MTQPDRIQMTHSKNIPEDAKKRIINKAVGYIRVSTEKQEREGEGLERQTQEIRDWCKKQNLQLLSIHEDTASAVGEHSYQQRDGLRGAHKQALQEEAVLVVYEPTRLFRNIDAAQYFLSNLPVSVFSIKNKRYLKKIGLEKAIIKGAETAENIAAGTKKALQRLKREDDKLLGSPTGLDKSRIASIKERMDGAQKVVETVADVLQRDEAYKDLTMQDLADLLNRKGILTNWNRPWTDNSIRKVRKKANDYIEEQKALEAALDLEEAQAPSTDCHLGSPEKSAEDLIEEEKKRKEREKEEERKELENHPLYGMF